MPLSVLYIGGTGQISLPCVEASVGLGHKVTVLNRGQTDVPLPASVEAIAGAVGDDAGYANLGDKRFDVVCQFRVYTAEQMQRDIATFAGRTGQYVFISSASAYQKPAHHYVITEKTPLENPYWEYSRNKIACEALLAGQEALPWTVVRPSHTVRTGMPLAIGDIDVLLRRLMRGAPLIVHGDGMSLWTLTRSVDFAQPFVRLLGNSRALRDEFQITASKGFTWNQIHDAIGRGFGVEAVHAHVPTDTLIRYNPAWEGPLMGDKAWPALFDNTKVKSVAGDFSCAEDLDTILEESIRHGKARLQAAAPLSDAAKTEEALMERIIADQARLGA